MFVGNLSEDGIFRIIDTFRARSSAIVVYMRVERVFWGDTQPYSNSLACDLYEEPNSY